MVTTRRDPSGIPHNRVLLSPPDISAKGDINLVGQNRRNNAMFSQVSRCNDSTICADRILTPHDVFFPACTLLFATQGRETVSGTPRNHWEREKEATSGAFPPIRSKQC